MLPPITGPAFIPGDAKGVENWVVPASCPEGDIEPDETPKTVGVGGCVRAGLLGMLPALG